jgi:hypothetical protein
LWFKFPQLTFYETINFDKFVKSQTTLFHEAGAGFHVPPVEVNSNVSTPTSGRDVIALGLGLVFLNSSILKSALLLGRYFIFKFY